MAVSSGKTYNIAGYAGGSYYLNRWGLGAVTNHQNVTLYSKTPDPDQPWKFTEVSSGGGGGTSKQLSMPVNINQNYTGNPSTVRSSGCALCSGIDVSGFYGYSANNTVEYFFANYWGTNGY